MSFTIKSVILIGVVLIGVVVGRWTANNNQSAPAAAEEHTETADHTEPDKVTLDEATQRQLKVTFETAQRRPVTASIEATGTIAPNETRSAHIRPLVRGRVEEVHVRLGQRVAANQTLMTYDNVEIGGLVSEHRRAAAALEQANAEVDVARRAVERAQNLVELGAISRAELEQRTAAQASAGAAVKAHLAERTAIEEKLRRFGVDPADPQLSSRVELRAPFAGVVTEYDVGTGEIVEPGQNLMAVTDLSTVWVQANVYEKDLASVRIGQTARVHVTTYPGQPFLGQVTYVSDSLDPQTRTAKIRVEVANRNSLLKVDMFARVQLPTANQREILAVPDAAIQTVGNDTVVFVRVSESEFQKRSITTQSTFQGWTEVLTGLQPGDVVVVQGSFALKSALLKEELAGDEH